MEKSNPGRLLLAPRAIPLLLLLFFVEIASAEARWEQTHRNTYQISIDGALVQGTYANLLRRIQMQPSHFILTKSISLNSPGGLVSEAMKLAEFVESTGLLAVVEAKSTCASSCFLLYVAAPMRMSNGRILLHRPYVDGATYAADDMTAMSQKHRVAMQQMSNFLQERLVSQNLIEKLMGHASNEAYEPSDSELTRDVGFFSASFEEIAISKCNISRSALESGAFAENSCVHSVGQFARIEFLKTLIGDEQTKVAIGKALARLREQ